MFKDSRYINAGENEIYRYGHKAVDKVKAFLEPNEKGFYSIPADGGKYWTIGTSTSKFGEFAKYKGAFLSVNSYGYVWAKVGTDKAEKFLEMVNGMIEEMHRLNEERLANLNDDEDEE